MGSLLSFRLHPLCADDGHPRRQLCGGNQAATERIILFGRELQALSEQLGREYGKNLAHTEMLQVPDTLCQALGTPEGRRNGPEWAPVTAAVECGGANSVAWVY